MEKNSHAVVNHFPTLQPWQQHGKPGGVAEGDVDGEEGLAPPRGEVSHLEPREYAAEGCLIGSTSQGSEVAQGHGEV